VTDSVRNERDFLESSIGFLMGVVYRKITTLLMHRLKDYDITPDQWVVLYRIQEREGMIQKEIAEKSGKDKPAVTRILDALESKGLITREPGKQDRRSFLVYATEKGRSLIRETKPIERQTIREAAAGIGGSDHELLLALLRRINENVDALITKE